MNLNKVKKIYKGDTAVNYAYTKNLKAFSPTFTFLKLTEEGSWQITVNNAGVSSINGDIWNWYFLSNTYRWLKNNSTSTRIQYSFSRRQWELISSSLTSTYVYSCSAYNSVQFPKDQWVSWNPEWSPPPTLIKIASAVPVLSQYAINNIQSPVIPSSEAIGTFQIEPPLVLNVDYHFDASTNSFVGITSSTNFDSITGISTRSTPTQINLAKLPNLEYLNYLSTYGDGLEVTNNSKIKKIGYLSRFSNKITITNNSNLEYLNVGDLRETLSFDKINIYNNPKLKTLRLTLNNLNSYNVDHPFLSTLYLQCTNMTNLTLTNLGDLQEFIIKYTSLTGSKIIDQVYANMANTVFKNLEAPIYLHYNQAESDLSSGFGGIVNIGLLGRTISSNNDFLFLYRNNKLNNNSVEGRATPELDPLYPKSFIPLGTFTTTLPTSTIIFNAPVINNTTSSTYIQASFLSGEYIYTGNIKEGRSVFSNINDYHILYNNNIQAWTLVGPTSTSNTVWVSAYASIADYGNVPTVGWKGPSYQTGNWQGDTRSPWFTSSSIYSKSLMLYLSSRYEPGGGRYHANPYSGYNPNFYWKHLDFSGVGWNVSDGSIAAPISQRAILISPIHFVGNKHWPGEGWKNKTIAFYHLDGSISTRTCLSSVDVDPPNAGDRSLGILNSPVSAAYYRVGVNSYLKNIEISDVKNFIWGPGQYGKVGVAMPIVQAVNTYTANNINALYQQISSVPASLWYGERIIGGDSSSPYWYINNNELIFIGSEQGAGPSGPRVNVQTTNQLMTALSLQFFGPATNYYTLSVYDFELL
jgi:hypothetical protein